MKPTFLFSLFFIFTLTFAWSNQDHEIFQINEAVKNDLGQETTFYSWLNLPKGPKSSYEEINKAYRKLSRRLHPDKIRGSSKVKKAANERFARLGVVGNILRGPPKERYDYFLDKGFPKWKGTGYYYSKFRPGLIGVLVFLYLFGSVSHYLLLSLQVSQDKKRIANYITQIQNAAWPNGITPGDLSSRTVELGNGNKFLVTFDGSVFMMEEDNQKHPINSDDVAEAAWRSTILFKIPKFFWNLTVGNINKNWYWEAFVPEIKPKSSESGNVLGSSNDDNTNGEEATGSGTKLRRKRKVGNAKSLANGIKMREATKAGGRRR